MYKKKQIIKRKKIFLLSILVTSFLFFVVFFCMGKILGHIEQQHEEVVSDVGQALESNLESGKKNVISNITGSAEKCVSDVTEHIKVKVDGISEYFQKNLDNLKEHCQMRLDQCIDHLEQHTKEHLSQTFNQVLNPQIEQNLISLKSNILNIFSNWLFDSCKFEINWNFLKFLPSFLFPKSDTLANNNVNGDLNNDLNDDLRDIEIK
ncbi:hypothetical protein [Candidatus Phytoplasma gossypii]|uniref:Effector n=1 Tax=Candidatus Phytoplasma gossypii TaxID=2982629 RepID=A0ABT9D0R3_9MOLU|nr:hypothetical protein ['Gossypium sp.' phytoplasma]MDO8057301.1 hypothetical protein ['Gossypium sp.' phytoplasma]